MSNDPALSLLRRRTWAGWVDVLVLFVVAVAISIVTGNAHATSSSYNGSLQGASAGFSLPTGSFLLWIAVAVLYYAVSEVLTGQTVGKRLFGLRVVMVSGRPLDGRAVALRTIGRFVDALPVFYLVGWLTLRGRHRPPQRLGDRIAGTTVVRV